MSKLYEKYTNLKKNNPDLVYLFKSGIFYIALEDDAIKLSENLKLNIGKLNEQVVKVGFPVSSRERYVRFLEALNIPFQFVDDSYGIIENYSDYANNEKLKGIVNKILSIDFDNLTFKEAFEILLGIQKELQVIYSDEGGTKNARKKGN